MQWNFHNWDPSKYTCATSHAVVRLYTHMAISKTTEPPTTVAIFAKLRRGSLSETPEKHVYAPPISDE